MNSSVYSADRATHLRIIIAALLASIAMIVFALAVHVDQDAKYAGVAHVQANHTVKLSGQATPLLQSAARRI